MNLRRGAVTDYQEKINDIASNIPKEIVDITSERVKGRRPTQAVSNFLTNKEQGDWAEDIVREKACEVLTNCKVVKYGKTDDVMAGDESFPEFFDRYQDELDTIGKRPDLLFFEDQNFEHEDISGMSFDEHVSIVPNALMGWEVRSSSYLSQEYKPSKSSKRDFLSFTVKIEDIIIVLKWIQTYGVPHYYAQVFFDGVYVISFKKILEIISKKENLGNLFFVEKNTKNQMKTTIHINIAQGRKLGTIKKTPNAVGARKKLAAGRLLHYVKFEGGDLEIDVDVLNEIIDEAKEDLTN